MIHIIFLGDSFVESIRQKYDNETIRKTNAAIEVARNTVEAKYANDPRQQQRDSYQRMLMEKNSELDRMIAKI